MYSNLAERFDELLNCIEISGGFAVNDVTYKELAVKAAKLARFFREKEISYGDVIAIASTKSVDDYAVMVACIYSGVVYTHIDISNPIERIKEVLSQCDAKLVFSSEPLAHLLPPIINYQDVYVATPECELVISKHLDGSSLAYIMFTSGSTGMPKGVAVTHQNLLHFNAWVKNRFNVSQADKFAQISPLYFDNSVFDIYGGLFNGASLLTVSNELVRDAGALLDYFEREQPSVIFAVPSFFIFLLRMKVLNEHVLRSVEKFVFGGEGFIKSELKKIFDLYHPNAQFINVYGPTECTCICSSYTIEPDEFCDMSNLPALGEINNNISYEIINQHGQQDKEGELFLLGPLVANGYFNDRELTQKFFEPLTKFGHYRKPCYRTGDRVRLNNGKLYFLGRLDNQIKHMGYRIELEEIESRLLTLEAVDQVLVCYQKTNAAFGEIVAFVITHQLNLEQGELYKQAAKVLPGYMVPGRFEFLDVFPKNSNGKVSRKMLMEDYAAR